MVEKVKPLKFMFDPLYWTKGTEYEIAPAGGDNPNMANRGDGTYSGLISSGASAGWEAVADTKANDCYELTLVNRKSVDLTGLTMQSIALAPLGNASQRMEQFSAGYQVQYDNTNPQLYEPFRDARLLVKEYVFYTTKPISNTALNTTIFNTFSTQPPYGDGGDLAAEQLVAGWSATYVQDKSLSPLDGFLVKIHSSQLGFGDIINAPRLYCTRVVYCSMRAKDLSVTNCSGNATTSPLFLDIPQTTEVITVAEIEPDEIEYFTAMKRSLQPPKDK